jgi:hypothetical protein
MISNKIDSFLPTSQLYLTMPTLLKLWKDIVKHSIEAMFLIPLDTTGWTVEEVYDSAVSEYNNCHCIDEEELSEAQLAELLGKFDEDDDLTNIKALLFRYVKLMFYIKKEWVHQEIQYILNRKLVLRPYV